MLLRSHMKLDTFDTRLQMLWVLLDSISRWPLVLPWDGPGRTVMTVAETRAIRAEYIGDLVEGLAGDAREVDFSDLAHILDMANMEARGCAKRHANKRARKLPSGRVSGDFARGGYVSQGISIR